MTLVYRPLLHRHIWPTNPGQKLVRMYNALMEEGGFPELTYSKNQLNHKLGSGQLAVMGVWTDGQAVSDLVGAAVLVLPAAISPGQAELAAFALQSPYRLREVEKHLWASAARLAKTRDVVELHLNALSGYTRRVLRYWGLPRNCPPNPVNPADLALKLPENVYFM